MRKWTMIPALLLVMICLTAGFAEHATAEMPEIGSVMVFGRYEQDNNPDNGPEPIEWIVLDVQDGKALLLSRYGLDARPYNDEYTFITWEQCTLRSWLNITFRDTAFSDTEREAIRTVRVDNSTPADISGWTEQNDTQDQIFLLGYSEVFEHYFSDNENRKCIPTEYAAANGAWISQNEQKDGKPTGFWLLRTGSRELYAMCVDCSGDKSRAYVCIADDLIRPALWLDLSAGV